MNQRPFISTQLNIFDENRCVFSPSMIAGQPVMISQEQNRKTCDSLTTAIASNQPRIQSCFCSNLQSTYPNQQQVWSCPLQAQKQGVPGGVVFNFPQPNYYCPPSCIPSAYNPPPPPCPQVVDCPNRTPQSICVDFGKFGLEAMAFQQKCRQQCHGFTYDKQVGTSNQTLFPKCNTCCCGVQSVTLNAEQKDELFHKVDETDSKSKLKLCICDPIQNKRCCCFPRPDPNKFGSAKSLVIGERKEKSCKDYDIVDQATREADAEAYLCCDCLDKWKKENEKTRPSCLKKRCQCLVQEISKDVTFCFRGKTLEITEEKQPSSKSEESTSNQYKIQEIDTKKEPCLSEDSETDIIKKLNELKRKRKRTLKTMQKDFTTTKEILEQLDKEIDDLRVKLCGKQPPNSVNKDENAPKTQEETKTKFQEIHGTTKLILRNEEVKKNIPSEDQYDDDSKLDSNNRNTKTDSKNNILQETNSSVIIYKPADEDYKGEKQAGNEKEGNISNNLDLQNPDIQNGKVEESDTKQDKNGKEDIDAVKRQPTDIGYAVEESVAILYKGENRFDSMVVNPELENTQGIEGQQKGTIVDNTLQTTNDPRRDQMERYGPEEPTNQSAEVSKPSSHGEVDEKPSPKNDIITEQSDSYSGEQLNQSSSPNNVLQDPNGVAEEISKINKSSNKKYRESSTSPHADDDLYASKPGNSSAINTDEVGGLKMTTVLEQEDRRVLKLDRMEEKPEETENIATEDVSNFEKKDLKQIPYREDAEEEKNEEIEEDKNYQDYIPSSSQTQIEEIGTRCYGDNSCRRIIRYIHDQDDEDINQICRKKQIDKEWCTCCTCNMDCKKCCRVHERIGFESHSREDNSIFAFPNIISNMFCRAKEKAGNLLNYLTGYRSCTSTQPFYENPQIITDRYYCGPEWNRHECGLARRRNVCPCRMDTNRFCGKTCYDRESNRWYSCCYPEELKVVNVTFRETAERRTIRLENNCRNSIYHVVYE